MLSCLMHLLCVGLLMSYAAAESSARSAGSTLNFVSKYSRMLDATQLEKLKASPSVGTVYFFKNSVSTWTNRFLSKYDKSAGFLNAYGLPLGLVDCSGSVSGALERECRAADDQKIYTYRRGSSLLVLDVATMFDVDSIMSNILQLALMNEVPIIQTKAGRQQLEHDNAGQMDIAYAYHNAVGTYEHRVFMEIAYAYQDKYKFVVSTEPSTTADLQDADLMADNAATMMWVLYCRDRYNAASGCRSVNYRGDFNLIALATFFKQLSWPKVMYHSGSKKEIHPCEHSDETACVIVSHSPATKEKADAVIDSIQFDLHGMAGLIVRHTNGGASAQDPQLTMKKVEGKYVTMSGKWELDSIESFISSHLFPISEHTAKPEEESEEFEEPSTIDDMMVHVAYEQRQTIGKAPLIPALTDKTFPFTTQSSKLVIVLFYLPFDSQSMLFLEPYQEAGKKLAALKGGDPLAHPLVRVNCFDWTDVCQKENITSYPVVYIFRNRKKEQYRSALDTDVLVHSVMLLQAEQPLMLTTAEEVTSFLDGKLPNQAYDSVDNLVLLKLSNSQTEMATYKAVVQALETKMLFAIVRPDVETSFVPNGGVLHKRTKDQIQPTEAMTENLDANSIIDFLQKGQFNTFPELTFLNFPTLFARKQPFAILFYNSSLPSASDLQQTVINIIQSGKVPDMIFCKMTVDDSNPVAKALLLHYSQTSVLPTFAVVSHGKGEVYVLQDGEIKEGAVLPWLQAVQNGAVVPSKILDSGEWKPVGRHYDFLAIMDREKKNRKKEEMSKYMMVPEEEPEDLDNDTRTNLLEIHKSRLYSNKDRKTPLYTPGHQETARGSFQTVSAQGNKKGSPQHTEL